MKVSDQGIIQDETNALNVKARLHKKGVSREVLDPFISKYEDAVHKIIYPII